MSILHVKAPRREKHTLALSTEPVFQFKTPRFSVCPQSRGCIIAALFRTLNNDKNASSPSLRSYSSLSTLTTSPSSSQHEFSLASHRSSFSSVSTHSSPPHIDDFTSAGAKVNWRSIPQPFDHHPSSTRLDASNSTRDQHMASTTSDSRASPARDDTETRDSAISGLSILSDDTDHFYQRSIEHLRDRQRLRDAATNPRAFARARPTKLSMSTLDRDQAKSDSTDQDSRPTRSKSVTQGPEHAANVPKEWGRKGRQSSDFLRRINSTGDMDDRRKEDEAEEAVGNLPEQDSPLSSKKRQSRIPGPRVKRSIDDLMDRERRERAGSHDRGSSPVGGTDPISSVEIELVKDRGVASSRLADVAKRSLRMPGSLASAFRRAEEPVGKTMDNILGQLNDGMAEAESQKTAAGENKSSGTVAVSQNDATAAGTRPKNKRNDSRDLLRRFARASTTSPTPSPAREALKPLADNAVTAVERTADTLPTPDQTPPRKSSSVRQSVHGALSAEGPSSLRSSPSISKVPTRSSSLRSLRTPPRNLTKRLSQVSASKLLDEPVQSVETASPYTPDSRRSSLPPVQEPLLDQDRHPDPLRSHPVTPEHQRPATFSSLVGNVATLAADSKTRDSAEEARALVRGVDYYTSGPAAEEPFETLEREVELDETVSAAPKDVREQILLHADERAAFDDNALRLRQSRGLRKRKPLRNVQAQDTVMVMGECPNCQTQVATAMPTLWDVSLASLRSTGRTIANALVQHNQAGSMRPTRLSYWMMAMLTWLLIESSLCRIYCPHYCTYWFPSYTDMQINSPRFPFVLPWKLVLEPTQHLWRGPWQTWLGAIEPRGWGLAKHTTWRLCKAARIDWLFGPGDERLEGVWDWPWWWTYFYGAAYGADWRCVGCTTTPA